jgi:hypothetical protein
VSQWRRRFEVGALDADVGSPAQQLQALLARVQNTAAVHIKDLTLGELDNTQRRPAPRSASTVRVRFASQQRCVESDACRPELASRCCQQLLAACCCPTLLAMLLPEDFRLQTCARLLIAANSPN